MACGVCSSGGSRPRSLPAHTGTAPYPPPRASADWHLAAKGPFLKPSRHGAVLLFTPSPGLGTKSVFASPKQRRGTRFLRQQGDSGFRKIPFFDGIRKKCPFRKQLLDIPRLAYPPARNYISRKILVPCTTTPGAVIERKPIHKRNKTAGEKNIGPGTQRQALPLRCRARDFALPKPPHGVRRRCIFSCPFPRRRGYGAIPG